MERQNTILVVDDEPMAHDIIEGHLVRDGYALAFANDGPEALAYLENHSPDVVLLDVMMPGMDGFTVCQQLKADDRWRHIPIILVTALGGKEDLARGIEAGADDFVTKPVDEMELRARVRSMLRIKKQYDDLQAALQLREDLARMIVHDARTPLTAILGFSELLQLNETMPLEDLDKINKIHSNARRLDSFFNDILIVAKMEEAGQVILNRTMVSINGLVQRLVEDQSLIAEMKRITIVLDLPAESRLILVDANLFQRVIENLLSNAVKFSPVDSTVTIEIENLAQDIETGPLKPNIRLKVLDEGPGIDQENRKRIFEKFEVIDLGRQDTPQLGLGLVFCKMVVEAHEGRIYIEDNQPAGSIFCVEI